MPCTSGRKGLKLRQAGTRFACSKHPMHTFGQERLKRPHSIAFRSLSRPHRIVRESIEVEAAAYSFALC